MRILPRTCQRTITIFKVVHTFAPPIFSFRPLFICLFSTLCVWVYFLFHRVIFGLNFFVSPRWRVSHTRITIVQWIVNNKWMFNLLLARVAPLPACTSLFTLLITTQKSLLCDFWIRNIYIGIEKLRFSFSLFLLKLSRIINYCMKHLIISDILKWREIRKRFVFFFSLSYKKCIDFLCWNHFVQKSLADLSNGIYIFYYFPH